MSKNNIFLFLEKSDNTRVSKGINGYSDKTGKEYKYDNLVPNYKKVKMNDLAIIRKENKIIGITKVEKITESESTKEHNRCPTCKKTDIRKRKSRQPKYKCGKCSEEFNIPDTTEKVVTSFTAYLSEYLPLENAPSVKDVKKCAIGGNGAKSRLSILPLDPVKILKLMLKLYTDSKLIEFIDYLNDQNSQIGISKEKSSEQRRASLLKANKIPKKQYAKVTVYNRNPDVVIEVLNRANGICEKCKKKAPFFRKSDKTPYLEVHHKIRLADNGEDTVENAIAVCPNCHRELHYG